MSVPKNSVRPDRPRSSGTGKSPPLSDGKTTARLTIGPPDDEEGLTVTDLKQLALQGVLESLRAFLPLCDTAVTLHGPDHPLFNDLHCLRHFVGTMTHIIESQTV